MAAAQAEADTEFVQTTDSEIAEVLMSPPFRAPFIALRKQQPEHFTAFGMVLVLCSWLYWSCRPKIRTLINF